MLFGREREQAAISDVIRAARAGLGNALAIVGEAGIGKSALLSHAETLAEGMSVLSVRGVQSEAHVPFASLFELLRPALGTLERIPRLQADALGGSLALRPSRGEGPLAIGAATLSLFAAYAERQPLIVLVDDAHWLDGSSGSALRFAARRLGAEPIAILIAVREGEPSLLDQSGLPHIAIAGLDLAASTTLLRHRRQELGDNRSLSDMALRLHRETGGNPLALLELSDPRSWREETPLHEPLPAHVTVGRAYAERFDSLSPDSRKVVLLLAASGSDDLSVLARPAAAIGAGGLDDLGAAEAAGLLTLHGTRVEWRHPLVRSAVYGAASPSERRGAHRALADSLPDAEHDRRAWHLSLSVTGPDGAAASALERAGIRARDRSAYQEACLAFEGAAALTVDRGKRAGLLYGGADAAWLAGSAERANRLLDDAAAFGPDAVLSLQIEHLRGHIATRRGNVQEGRSVLLSAAEAAAGVDDKRAVVMLAEAVNACFYAGDPTTMRLIAERIPEVVSRCTDSRSAFFGGMSEGMALVFCGEGDRGPRMIRRAMGLLESSDELRDDPRLLAWAAMGPLYLREGPDWSRFVDRALTVAREHSAAGILPFLLTHVAVYDASTDRWSEAEALFYESIDLATETGQHAERAAALARLSLLEARTGRFDTSVEHASEALAQSTSLGLGLSEVWSLASIGEAALTRGDPKQAMEYYERQQAVLTERGIHDADLSAAPELVEVYLRLGLEDPARRLGATFAEVAEAKGLPWARARAARTRALLAHGEESEALFEEAIALHSATLDVFEAARTHLAYGSRLRRSRQRVRARAQLRLAISVFDRLGAEPWGEATRAELGATGEHVAKRGASSVAQLTPQELQVAILLGQRRTTREAAAVLYLSPKTIEYHLRSIYRKLGVASRDELAATMDKQRSP